MLMYNDGVMKANFVSTAEAAKILGVSRITVFNKIKTNKIPAIKIGRNFVIRKDDVLKVVEELLTNGQKRSAIRKIVKHHQTKKARRELLLSPTFTSPSFSILSPPHRALLTMTKRILLPLSSLILFIALFGGLRNLPLAVGYLEKQVGRLATAPQSLFQAKPVWELAPFTAKASTIKIILTHKLIAWWQTLANQTLAYSEEVRRWAESSLANLKTIWSPTLPRASQKLVAQAVVIPLNLTTIEKITAQMATGKIVDQWEINRLTGLKIYSRLAYASINQIRWYGGHLADRATTVPQAGQLVLSYASSYVTGTGIILVDSLDQSRLKWRNFITTNKRQVASTYVALSLWPDNFHQGTARLAMVGVATGNGIEQRWQSFFTSNQQKILAVDAYLTISKERLFNTASLNLALARVSAEKQITRQLSLTRSVWYHLTAPITANLIRGKLALADSLDLNRVFWQNLVLGGEQKIIIASFSSAQSWQSDVETSLALIISLGWKSENLAKNNWLAVSDSWHESFKNGINHLTRMGMETKNLAGNGLGTVSSWRRNITQSFAGLASTPMRAKNWATQKLTTVVSSSHNQVTKAVNNLVLVKNDSQQIFMAGQQLILKTFARAGMLSQSTSAWLGAHNLNWLALGVNTQKRLVTAYSSFNYSWHNILTKSVSNLAMIKSGMVNWSASRAVLLKKQQGKLDKAASLAKINTTHTWQTANVKIKLAAENTTLGVKTTGVRLSNWVGYEGESIHDTYDGLVSVTARAAVNLGHTLAALTRQADQEISLAGQTLAANLVYVGKQTTRLAATNVASVHQGYADSLSDSALIALGVAGKMIASGYQTKELMSFTTLTLAQKLLAARSAMIITAEQQVHFSAGWLAKTAVELDQEIRLTLGRYQAATQLAGVNFRATLSQTGIRLGLIAKDTLSTYRSGSTATTQSFNQLTTVFYLTGDKLSTNVQQSLSAKIATNVSEPLARLREQGVATAGQIDNGFLLWYEEYILRWWNRVADIFYHTGHNALASWSDFIHGRQKQTVGVAVNSDLKDQIKQEVMDEIKQQMTGAASQTVFNQVTGASGNQTTGLVVIPESGTPALNELEKQQIQRAFSDKVVIYLDRGGKTGVIQPVFKNSVGNRYLFILTPISNQ